MTSQDTTATHTYELTIKEFHLDTFGHVNNATYLSLYEEARWELITKNGYGLNAIQKIKKGPIILSAEIKFLKEIKLRENIKIKTQMVDYTSKVGRIKQWMENELGQVCSEVVLTFGLFDLVTRKLISPNEEWLTAIGAKKLS